MTYYNAIAQGYDQLHKEEQLNKLRAISVYIKPKGTLLDVGCGTGISTAFFKVPHKTGIDPSDKLLTLAKQKYPHITFMQAAAEDIPCADHSFDVVISLTAIQNFSNIEQGLKEIKRVGKQQFILSYMKKTQKAQLIDVWITDLFSQAKRYEIYQDIVWVVG
ncbi:MAG: class I SAM-dependent methyltransferase [Candidatus Woesearchaeota archaeon]